MIAEENHRLSLCYERIRYRDKMLTTADARAIVYVQYAYSGRAQRGLHIDGRRSNRVVASEECRRDAGEAGSRAMAGIGFHFRLAMTGRCGVACPLLVLAVRIE